MSVSNKVDTMKESTNHQVDDTFTNDESSMVSNENEADVSRDDDKDSHDDSLLDTEFNENNGDDPPSELDSSQRRSSRNRDSANKIETKLKESKKGSKRKSVPNADSVPKKTKLPKYEQVPVSLKAKTIHLGGNRSNYKILDRSRLTTIPPKEGSYEVGDLIWSKMTGYPWWPCMVTIDPVTGTYSKVSGASYKADRVYHIQWFGAQAYRGWTNIGMTMLFEGADAFFKKIENEVNDLDKKRKSKVMAKYAVKGSIQKKLNESIAEAEEALKLDKKNRLEVLNFNYILESELKESKSVSKSVNSTPRNSKMNSKKKNKSTDDIYDFVEDEDDAFDDGLLSGFRFPKRKGDFNVYVKKHLDDELKNYPDLSKSDIIEKMREKWNGFPEEFRSLYVERKAIYEDESNMLVSKRSNFDDDYFDSDSDYDDSDSLKNGFERSESLSIKKEDASKINKKSKKSKVNKSEQLFDRIKNTIDLNDSDIKIEKPKRVSTPRQKFKKDQTSSEETVNTSIILNTIKTKSKNEQSNEKSVKKLSSTISKSISSVNENNSSAVGKPINDVVKEKFSITSEESNDALNSDVDSEIKLKVNNGKMLEESFCHQCGESDREDDKLVSCIGKCNRKYHLKCDMDVKMNEAGNNKYQCNECESGKYKCVACKNPNDLETRKCEDVKCNKYYHLSCIENYPIRVNESANTFLCPSHSCINCHLLTLDDNECRVNKRKLVQCIRCPISYHTKEVCIGAGTIRISKNFVICPEHYDQFSTSNRNNRHINVNYCFACIKVGNLICCEKCPAAFHEECLEYNFDHDQNFYCSGCLLHKQLHYGDIVWVKLGQYRWWPGKISPPNETPENVLKLHHNYCEFPVFFFGSHDYYWVHRGRVFSFVEEDNQWLTSTQVKGNKNSTIAKTFFKAMTEAAMAFKDWQENSNKKNVSTISAMPPKFHHISCNKYLNAKNNGNSSELNNHICDCAPESKDPCSDDSCLNRISRIECDSSCPCGEKCQNQRFVKKQYANVDFFRTKSAGWGLKALEDIKKGQFVIEYVGEIIDEKECEVRLQKTKANFYFLTIDKDTIIDAGPKGNYARFMNHSCEPNCVTQKWMVNNQTRVGLFALKNIPSGTELTFDYNLECRGNEQIPCKCGSILCSGYIGLRSKTTEQNDNQTKQLITKNGTKINDKKNSKKTSTHNLELHDHIRECFKCGEANGKLVDCSKSECLKSYHIACLNMSQAPENEDHLVCPRHRCMINECNESAHIFCSVCPNSLCKQHASNCLQLPDNKFLCEDHRSSDEEGLITEISENNVQETKN